jgi:hypothetical protein
MTNRTRKSSNLISQLSYNYLTIVTDKNNPEYGTLKLTAIDESVTGSINIADLDIYSDYIGFGTFFIDNDGFLVSNIDLGKAV